MGDTPIMNDLMHTQAAARIAARHKRMAHPGADPAHSVQTPPVYWQNWKEQDGRWVACGDPLPPGYVADLPQFEPLPGEEVATPAFPRKYL